MQDSLELISLLKFFKDKLTQLPNPKKKIYSLESIFLSYLVSNTKIMPAKTILKNPQIFKLMGTVSRMEDGSGKIKKSFRVSTQKQLKGMFTCFVSADKITCIKKKGDYRKALGDNLDLRDFRFRKHRGETLLVMDITSISNHTGKVLSQVSYDFVIDLAHFTRFYNSYFLKPTPYKVKRCGKSVLDKQLQIT